MDCEHEFEYNDVRDTITCQKCLRTWWPIPPVKTGPPFEFGTSGATSPADIDYTMWYLHQKANYGS